MKPASQMVLRSLLVIAALAGVWITSRVTVTTAATRAEPWWSFQPLKIQNVPAVKQSAWSDHPVDRFLLAKLEERGLSPASPTDRPTLLRRATFALTGLPPTVHELEAFLADASREAYEKAVDRLLASPHFGERWARHWMDLVRFAETHGSEGDPEIPEAWRYRDYLIRAFNSDVPADQLIREHIAGDLLPQPRWNRAEALNESILGIAHHRFVEHGFQPVDTLDDQVKVIENQIDVLGKAFQALTLACARCHDHKFDPITQRDFYALYGVFASSRPGQVTIDAPERLRLHRDELAKLKEEIKLGLVKAWDARAKEFSALLLTQLGSSPTDPGDLMLKQITGLERDLARLEWNARQRTSRAENNGPSTLPIPAAAWSFANTLSDFFAAMPGELKGGAYLKNGRLVLNGKSAYFLAGPLPQEIREKTLEVWTALGNTEQQGGGAMTLEIQDGSVFDAIVFGELEIGRWLAGSENYRRSRKVEGPKETSTRDQLLHLVIVYGADQTIAIYRNGILYGPPYIPTGAGSTLRTYPAEKSRVLLGLRHTGAANGFLAGEIEEARLYDRALTSDEVSFSFQAGPLPRSKEDLTNALTAAEREEKTRLSNELNSLRGEFQTRFPIHRQERASRRQFALVLEKAAQDAKHPLHPFAKLRDKAGVEFARAWESLVQQSDKELAARKKFDRDTFKPVWDLPGQQGAQWFKHGINPPETAEHPGEFSVEPEGDRILTGLYPAGVYSHLLSQKHNGVVMSPRFKIESGSLSIRALGAKGSRVRLIVDNYPLGSEGIFPQAELKNEAPAWLRLDTAYRKGSYAYLELAPAEEVLSRNRSQPGNGGRSYFGVERVVFHETKEPPEEESGWRAILLESRAPSSVEELAARYEQALAESLSAWRQGNLKEGQRSFLDFLIRSGLLPNSTNALEQLAPVLAKYRQHETELPVPRRAPGLLETEAFDAAFFDRGDHHKPKDPVPRGYPELLGGRTYRTRLSGRLELAHDITHPENPLTARVLVNRVWQQLFGRGLVATVDNFGQLGDKPTHPELLDYLAARFMAEGWSLKSLIRLLITSKAYRMSSEAPAHANELDPGNNWLSHMPVRRLEAEAIRDTLLAVSGRLDGSMFGPGASAQAPPADQKRRSIYFTIRRNSLNPFLELFDAPKPFTTLGQREPTNVPAQSLALLNDPFVIELATHWARALVGGPEEVETRVTTMFMRALSRVPNAAELAASHQYLAELGRAYDARDALIRNENVWRDFAQSIFNLKELIYLR